MQEKALGVLSGRGATIVAAAIRRKATTFASTGPRKNADTCADYLLAKRPYLGYPSGRTRVADSDRGDRGGVSDTS